jgi:hypothetical protein
LEEYYKKISLSNTLEYLLQLALLSSTPNIFALRFKELTTSSSNPYNSLHMPHSNLKSILCQNKK